MTARFKVNWTIECSRVTKLLKSTIALDHRVFKYLEMSALESPASTTGGVVGAGHNYMPSFSATSRSDK